MSYSRKTTKYPIGQFDCDLKRTDVTEKTLCRKGFGRCDGYLVYENKHKKALTYVVVEQDEDANNIYATGLAILNFLEFYHVTNIGVLVVDRIIDEYAKLKEKRVGVLYLHFNATENPIRIPENYSYKGRCIYEISIYPHKDDGWCDQNLPKLFEIATSCKLHCKLTDNILRGEDEFFDLKDIEKRLVDFANKTSAFDAENGTWTTVDVLRLTLPVINDDYYSDLYCNVKRSNEPVRYLGSAGELLQYCDGVFVETNINTFENIESLYKCIETFVEDING